MQIEKKILNEYFEKVLSGEKKFEIRLADWECNIGDTLVLREWDKESKSYTGRSLTKEISNIVKTKDLNLFKPEEVEEYGYQVLSLRDNKSRTGIDHIGICVSFVCHDGNGNTLLQKRSQTCRDERGTWDFGGGKMEFGEDFAQAALRELKEEYDCDGEIEYQLPVANVLRENDGVKTHWINVAFIIKVNPKEVKIGEPKDIDELGWFKLDKLPSPMHSSAGRGVKRHMATLKEYIR